MVALLLTEIVHKKDGKILSFGEVGATVIVNQHLDEFEGAKALKSIVKKHVGSLLSSGKSAFWFTDFLIDGNCNFVTNFLFKKAAIAKTEITSFVDLRKSESFIRNNIRKSFKPCISWGQRNFNISVFDRDNITEKESEAFQKLHEMVSGRATRSKESWLLRLKMVREGKAFMVLTGQRDDLISCSFFICDDSSVYYMSSASRREKFENPVMHSALWSAIQYAKDKGFRNFILGEVFPKSFGTLNVSDKDENISKFKAGFGGNLKPVLQIKSTI